MLYHPWFICYQVIYDFSMKKMMNHNVYITTIHLREDDNTKIYVGDTEGSIHLIKPEVQNKVESTYMIEKSNYNYHRIHIIQVLNLTLKKNLDSLCSKR